MSSQELPTDPYQWAGDVKFQKLENKTIHNISLTSGSTITMEQYLMLRVIQQRKPWDAFNPAQFGLEPYNKKATDALRTSSSWKSYVDNFFGKLPEGTFALPLFYQRQVSSLPKDAEFRPNVAVSPIAHRTRGELKNLEKGVRKLTFETLTKRPSTPNLEEEYEDFETEEGTPPEQRSYGPPELLDLNYPKTKDEQIVNTALIDFLNAFTIHINTHCHWSLYRQPFKVNFGGGSFEARTDGCLEGGGPNTHAIVDVKPMMRLTKPKLISMQEAADMVAWIKSEPDSDNNFVSSCGRRVLVSQDRHEIYLTFAEYDSNYVKYLSNTLRQNETPGFLTLHVFGPWETTRVGDMEKLGSILLAIALRAEAECERKQRAA